MNEDNLIQNQQRTPNERRENAKKAGEASGEARRKKRALKESMKLLLSLPVTDNDGYNTMAMMGIQPEDMDNMMLMSVGLFKAAADGDVRAYHEVRHLIGEHEDDGDRLDKRIKRAQIEKLKAETEEIRRRNDDGAGADEEGHRTLADALRESASAVWEETDDET